MSEREFSSLDLILMEQAKQTRLLTRIAEGLEMLVGVLAEEMDPDAEPMTYMDGSPCR